MGDVSVRGMRVSVSGVRVDVRVWVMVMVMSLSTNVTMWHTLSCMSVGVGWFGCEWVRQ